MKQTPKDRAVVGLHNRGIHWFCTIDSRPIVERWDLSNEYIFGVDGEKIDVTNQGGRPIYQRDGAGQIVYEEVHS